MLSLLLVFLSPTIVLWVWFRVFKSIAGRGSTGAGLVSATIAAGILIVGFFELGVWMFSERS